MTLTITPLDTVRDAIRSKLAEREPIEAQRKSILDTVAAESRSALTPEEETRVDAIRGQLKPIDDELDNLKRRESDLVEDETRLGAADALAASLPTVQKAGSTVRGGRPELTYRQGGEHSFLSDCYMSRFGNDYGAQQRLGRNLEEQRGEFGVEVRDVGTGAFTGFVIPQYLVDEYAPMARAGAPFWNSIRRVPLPAKGMVLNIGRITTGTAVAAQATENSAVQETDADDTLLAVNVRTFAGQQDVSRQALERGEMIEEITFGDLTEDYFTKVNVSALSADGTNGTHLGVLSVSSISDTDYTDASPTVAELWPKLANAVQKIPSNRFAPATVIYMHPRRWGWFAAALDSQGRPLFGSYDVGEAVNSIAVGEAGQYGQVVGKIMGLPVIADASIPITLGGGTEDAIIVARNLDFIKLEEGDGTPRYLRFEETTGGSLTVKLVAYGYSAFTAGRQPKSVSTVTDTGLVTPTF